MKPSIGRIVHYVANDGRHAPAVICEVYLDDVVALSVFQHPTKFFECPAVPGTWHWPERVE